MIKVENFGIKTYDFKNITPQKIIRLGHPTLHKKTPVFEDPTSNEARLVAKQLLATVDDFGPVSGLAAPQIDQSKRIFIFQVPPHRTDEGCDPIDITVAINPTIEPIGNEKISDWEGCLSAPDFLVYVERFVEIKYSYYDFYGNFIEGIARNFHAKVLQHEFDHLEGIMHTDRIKNPDDIGYIDEIKTFRF